MTDKILVVDDDADILNFVCEILELEGYQTDRAANGAEALQLYKKDFHKIIVTDANMPQMNGEELVKSVMATGHPTEVIVMSGYADMDMAISFIRLGVVAFLPKPFDPEELINTIKKINDKFRLIEEARKKQLDSIEYERLTITATMAAGLAHEINNPLSFISGDLQLLQADFEKTLNNITCDMPFDVAKMKDKVKNRFERCRKGYQRIASIINTLRTFSGVDQEDEYAECDINKSIEDALVLLSDKQKENTVIVKNFQPNLAKVYCYSKQLNHCFFHILLNAMQAVDKDPQITIATGTIDDANIFVRILDNGSGMPTEQIRYIYNPFYTTKNVGEGTGLGMTFTRNIIEKHHGRISIRSSPNVFTEVIIRLPIKHEKKA
ncbi:MAG: response regulator [Deltaproteobacteria bacterium]|nr:response regulator [Deltaproteobacteria bacterium]